MLGLVLQELGGDLLDLVQLLMDEGLELGGYGVAGVVLGEGEVAQGAVDFVEQVVQD